MDKVDPVFCHLIRKFTFHGSRDRAKDEQQLGRVVYCRSFKECSKQLHTLFV